MIQTISNIIIMMNQLLMIFGPIWVLLLVEMKSSLREKNSLILQIQKLLIVDSLQHL